MTGQLKMSCISSYSGHFSYLYFLIVRTQRFFRSFDQSVCLSTMLSFSSSTSVNKHISGTGAFRLSVRSSLSLMRVHLALMHAKLLFNDKRYVQ